MFGGATYDPDRDEERLKRQLAAVRRLMLDGKWRTLEQISQEALAPEASVSARLRDLRKKKFGAYNVERRYLFNGLWIYRVGGDKDGATDRVVTKKEMKEEIDKLRAALIGARDALLDVTRNGMKYNAHKANEALAAANDALGE